MKSKGSEPNFSPQYAVGKTNISYSLTAFLGAVATAIFYSILPFIQNSSFALLFYHRGWVPITEVYFTAWAVNMLFLKWIKYRTQTKALMHDILPKKPEIITPKNTSFFLNHIMTLPRKVRHSLLVIRIQRSLRHYHFRKSRSEIGSFISFQSEIDSATVDSSFSILRVIIWAIPIVGFIGTVLGIGQSVDGFSNLSDLSKLQSSLQQITKGLGGAFDTTLLALILSIIIMFPTSSLQKAEQDLLIRIDEYCNEQLICRLEESKFHDGMISQDMINLFKEAVRAISEELSDIIGANLKEYFKQISAFNNSKLTSSKE